jgi:hypothetical protein
MGEKRTLLTPWCRVLLEKLTGLQLVKKFPAFLWNQKVHHRTHKRPPPIPVLGQPNPVHIPTSHLLEKEKEHGGKKLIKVEKCKFVPVQTTKAYTIFIHLVVCLLTGP